MNEADKYDLSEFKLTLSGVHSYDEVRGINFIYSLNLV